MAKIGITGHNEEEIASMTPEQQENCFLDTEVVKPSKDTKPKKAK